MLQNLFWQKLVHDGSPVNFCHFCVEFWETIYISEILLKNYPISKKQLVESESGWGRYRWFKINSFFRIFCDSRTVAVQIWNSSAQIEIPITWEDAKWLFQFRKQVIIRILSNIDWTMAILNFRQVSDFFSKPSSWLLARIFLHETIRVLLLKNY